jgi:hypothetical protein
MGLVVLMAPLVGLAACASEAGEGSQAPETRDHEDQAADLDAFCAAMGELAAGDLADVRSVEELTDRVRASAPAEIRDDATEFSRHALGVTRAMAAAGAPDQEVDVDAVLEGLPPEQRAFVDDLVVASQTGEMEDNVVGRVLGYALTECG